MPASTARTVWLGVAVLSLSEGVGHRTDDLKTLGGEPTASSVLQEVSDWGKSDTEHMLKEYYKKAFVDAMLEGWVKMFDDKFDKLSKIHEDMESRLAKMQTLLLREEEERKAAQDVLFNRLETMQAKVLQHEQDISDVKKGSAELRKMVLKEESDRTAAVEDLSSAVTASIDKIRSKDIPSATANVSANMTGLLLQEEAARKAAQAEFVSQFASLQDRVHKNAQDIVDVKNGSTELRKRILKEGSDRTMAIDELSGTMTASIDRIREVIFLAVANVSGDAKKLSQKFEDLYKDVDDMSLQLREDVEKVEAKVRPFTVRDEDRTVVLQDWSLHVVCARKTPGCGNVLVGRGHNLEKASNSLAAGFGNIGAADGVVVFGETNTATGFTSVVTGGTDNFATETGAAVCGGASNKATGKWSTVAGGRANTASGRCATAAGGDRHKASGDSSTGVGGYGNEESGDKSTAVGGKRAKALKELSLDFGKTPEKR